ncbi:ABC transporter permease [Mesorhizobium sp. CGMCC 1.15528]|uniref:ABC transporter permease n=1 Tax=Mesorhizobium zhangyense TaxID=1776730 RepID=A0A7C9VA27_9HYPH|nr:ABC transporter permease [Mesorhizobium zhangyense]NGN40409.1 ABC transporter permease [Mesorhizobium zhangyense]
MKSSLQRPPLTAIIGLVIVATFLLLAIFGSYIAPYSEFETVGETWAPSSAEFLLGTDNLGRDILSRIIIGAQMTIGIAVTCTMLSFVIGTVVGLAASVASNVVDQIFSRSVDILLSIPVLIFALIVLSAFGSSMPVLILTIALIDAPRVFRVARALAMNVRNLEFVETAWLRGESRWWLMTREILPNILPPMISEFGLRFCFNFLIVAGLSFLGLGIQPPSADWGGMVRENGQAITFGISAPIWPALAIGLVTIGINLVVDWVLSMNARPSGASAEL